MGLYYCPECLSVPCDHITEILSRSNEQIERLKAEVDMKGYRLDDALDEIRRLRDELAVRNQSD